MGYSLEAVLGSALGVNTFAEGLEAARPVQLGKGIVLLPVTSAVAHEIAPGTRWDRPLRCDRHVPQGLVTRLESASGTGPIAYVEAGFFAGEGVQACVVWDRGKIVLGPLIENEDAPVQLAERSINQALRWLGVQREDPALDEFETVGLGRHRQTAEWLADV